MLCFDAGIFRGKVWKDDTFLRDCITVVTRAIQLQTLSSPLRRHIDMHDADGEEEELKAAPAPDVSLFELCCSRMHRSLGFRQVIDGMAIGRVSDIRVVGGQIRGPQVNDADTDPSDVGIDTGFTYADFSVGNNRVCVAEA